MLIALLRDPERSVAPNGPLRAGLSGFGHPWLRRTAVPRVADCADRGIAGALGKPNLAERRVTLGDTGAKPQIAATFAPSGDQLARRLTHRHNWSSVPSNWLTSVPNAPWYSLRKSKTSAGSAVLVKAV